MFKRLGYDLEGVEFDLLLATYIMNPSVSGEDVATLAGEFGYDEVQQNEVIYGKGAKWTEPEEHALAEHVSRKAMAVWTLYPILEEKLKENEQYELYHKLELPLARILGKMESEGITVKVNTLELMGEQLLGKLAKIEEWYLFFPGSCRAKA